MTDKTPDNDPVAEAEEIVKQSLSRLGTEECVEGDKCPIHFRLSSDEMDDSQEFGRLVDYVGDYAVVTSDNPDLDNPAVLLRLILGLYNSENAPAKYETVVIRVGEGSIGDLWRRSEQVRKDSIRHIRKHSDWANFRNEHEFVLSGLNSGLIDVSKPVEA